MIFCRDHAHQIAVDACFVFVKMEENGRRPLTPAVKLLCNVEKQISFQIHACRHDRLKPILAFRFHNSKDSIDGSVESDQVYKNAAGGSER